MNTNVIIKELSSINLSEAYHIDIKDIEKGLKIIKKLDDLVLDYFRVGADNLVTIEELTKLEEIKRKHTLGISWLKEIDSKLKSFKENGEYFANDRKKLKSATIQQMCLEEKQNTTSAERLVYNHPRYIKEHEEIRVLKEVVEFICGTYSHHREVVSRNIHQSISVAQNILKVEN